MAATTTEILMQFVPEASGKAVEAECMTTITRNDGLANQTGPGMARPFENGRFFLVDTFKFGVELVDGETESRDKAMKAMADLAAGKQISADMHAHLQKHMSDPAAAAASAGVQSFAKWRSATDDSWRRQDGKQVQPYNARIGEFSFTRRIDRSSLKLFKYLCASKDFAFATMIKRKSASVANSDLPENQSYLRLDFKEVAVSSMKWSDDDVIEETCTFHAKEMRVQFWTEKFDRITQTDGVLGFLNGAKWINQVTDEDG